MRKEMAVGATVPAPANAIDGVSAGHPLRCTVNVEVDRWRTVSFIGFIYGGYAIAGNARPLVFGQCHEAMERVLGTADAQELTALWRRCHLKKLGNLPASDRVAVMALANSMQQDVSDRLQAAPPVNQKRRKHRTPCAAA